MTELVIANVPLATLWRRVDALSAYELRLLQINEQSDAADRELDRVIALRSRLSAEITRRKAEQQV